MQLTKRPPSLLRVLDSICICLLAASVFSVIFRHKIQDVHDPYKCEALLTQGEWLDGPSQSTNGRPFQNWQPRGCMLHGYQLRDMEQCLRGRQITFIGDSTVRELFWVTARKIDAQRTYKDQHTAQKHSDITLQRKEISLQFIWDPYLNSTAITSHLQAMPATSQPDSSKPSTVLVVVGGGLWHARYLGDSFLEEYSEDVDSFIPLMDDQRQLREPDISRPMRLLLPVQVPWYEFLSEERYKTITPSRVEAMNQQLTHLSSQHNTVLLSAFAAMSSKLPTAYDATGLHVVNDVADKMADVLLNFRCNSAMPRYYPFDKTCCNRYPRWNWAQIVIMALVWTVSALFLLTAIRPTRVPGLRALRLPPPVLRSLAVLSLAIWYCLLADRSHLWNKAQKQFSLQEFSSLTCLATLFGAFTIRKSKQSSQHLTGQQSDVGFLFRDQTDEWKGWMQLVILIYHYTGASSVLPVYQMVRLLVASYLFMTGYGHTIFFLRKADFSAQRLLSVMIRLNMLSLTLPYMMGTDYVFYYFAPLTSFWYFVLYLTMFVQKERNHSSIFVAGKISISTLAVNLMIRKSGFLEEIFRLLENCCSIHWNLKEARFRLCLDSYIVFIGMLSGLLYVKVPDAVKGNNNDQVSIFLRQHIKKLRVTAISTACLALPLSGCLAHYMNTKPSYNALLPYLSWVPVPSFVILRNGTWILRNYHSAGFAWIGQISLETFTLQFHIWLAADTKGLLRTGLLGRYGDFVLLTIIFIWLSKKVSGATGVVTNWIIDPSRIRIAEVGDEEEEEEIDAEKAEKYKEDLPFTVKIMQSVGHGAANSVNGVKSNLARNLRLRIGLIILLLWGMNQTY